MDLSKVIRVQIDRPAYSTSACDDTGKYIGFLGTELDEVEEALQSGNHLGFGWPMWASKAKAAVKTVTPSQAADPATLEFQNQVQADLTRMITLLDTIANMMAAQGPQPMPAPAALPMAAAPVKPASTVVAPAFALPPSKNTGSIYTVPVQQVVLPVTAIQAFHDGRQPQFYPTACVYTRNP